MADRDTAIAAATLATAAPAAGGIVVQAHPEPLELLIIFVAALFGSLVVTFKADTTSTRTAVMTMFCALAPALFLTWIAADWFLNTFPSFSRQSVIAGLAFGIAWSGERWYKLLDDLFGSVTSIIKRKP